MLNDSDQDDIDISFGFIFPFTFISKLITQKIVIKNPAYLGMFRLAVYLRDFPFTKHFFFVFLQV